MKSKQRKPVTEQSSKIPIWNGSSVTVKLNDYSAFMDMNRLNAVYTYWSEDGNLNAGVVFGANKGDKERVSVSSAR